MSMSSLKTLFNSQQKFELLSWVMCKFKLAFLWNKLGWRTYPLCSVLGKNSRHLPWEYSTVRWWLPGRGRRRRRGAPGTWRVGRHRCWERSGRRASPGGRSISGRRTGRDRAWPGHRWPDFLLTSRRFLKGLWCNDWPLFDWEVRFT